MPQKVLKFTGINRIVNEYQNSGACEELINLRPEIVGSTKVVKPKDVLYENLIYPYEIFYIHSFGDTNNEIACWNGTVWWFANKNVK